MFSLGDFVMLFVVITAVALWVRQDHYRRRALALARKAAHNAGVQLLDQSVGFRGFRLVKDDRGWPLLQRRFSFEFSRSGFDRYRGHVCFEGEVVTEVALDLSDPHWRDESS